MCRIELDYTLIFKNLNLRGEIFMKTLEVLLNIFSYAIMAMFFVTVIRIGMKFLGIKIFKN